MMIDACRCKSECQSHSDLRNGQRMLERTPDAAATPVKPSPSIAFGLERIGLIAVRAPILSCIILLAMVIGAVFGIHRIKIDNSLSQLFRSDTRSIASTRK